MAVQHKRPTTTRASLRDTLSTQLAKTPTGIKGFDEITYGGLPKGRRALVEGRASSDKTLLGMGFLIRSVSAIINDATATAPRTRKSHEW